jgi:hypothetical protein
MMKRTISISILLILLLAGLPAPLTWAHNGPPRIELGAERAAPGVTIEVRGVNIAPEQPVTLTLIGGGQEFGFGTVVGNEHGDFAQIVTIPREAVAGVYTLRAFGLNRMMVAAPLTIIGRADDDEGEQRGEEEPLLAPMPRPQPAAPAGAPMTTSVPAPNATSVHPFAPWFAAGLAALAVLASLVIMARKRATGVLK